MKKKIVIAVIAAIVLAGLSFGAVKGIGMINAYVGTYKAFKAGEEAVQKKDYKGAIENYEKIYAGGYQYETAQKKLPELKKKYCKEVCEKMSEYISTEHADGDIEKIIAKADKIDQYIASTNKYIDFADEETKDKLNSGKWYSKLIRKEQYVSMECLLKGDYIESFIRKSHIVIGIKNNWNKDIKRIYVKLVALDKFTNMDFTKILLFDENDLKRDQKIVTDPNLSGDGCILAGEECGVNYEMQPNVWETNSFWFVNEEYDWTSDRDDVMKIYVEPTSIEYTDGEIIEFEESPLSVF